MKILNLLIILLVSTSALATESSESAFNSSDSSIHGGVGFSRGGFALGGEWEFRKERTYGVGAYLRLLAKDDGIKAHGVKALGGFIRPHFHRRAWDLFFTAGFGIAAVDSAVTGTSDETALGPVFGTGVYYQYNDKIAIGVEQLALYGWLADDFRGMIEQHVLAKMRWQL